MEERIRETRNWIPLLGQKRGRIKGRGDKSGRQGHPLFSLPRQKESVDKVVTRPSSLIVLSLAAVKLFRDTRRSLTYHSSLVTFTR